MSAKSWLALAVFLGTATGQNATPASSAVQANTAQKPLHTGTQAKPDLEVRAVADGALALAPEFGSDVLIRLAQSSRVPDQAMKLNLLEQAFYLAGQVDTLVRPGTSVFSPDTDLDTLRWRFACSRSIGYLFSPGSSVRCCPSMRGKHERYLKRSDFPHSHPWIARNL